MTTADRLPSVSVVIPTHERPGFLRRAVRSVIEQDYASRVQTLVLFDGCEPAAIPASDSPGQRAVVVLGNTRTPGALGARNTGILAADGDVVAFLDDDDEWPPSKLSRQVEVLMSGSADVVFSGVRCRTSRKRVPNTPRSSPSTRPNLLSSHARFALLAPGNGNPADAGKWARGRSTRTRDGRETGSCPRGAFDASISLDTLQALQHRLFWRRVSA
jgi:glycosyltransferase involved in cell wall biosynthesis